MRDKERPSYMALLMSAILFEIMKKEFEETGDADGVIEKYKAKLERMEKKNHA